MENLVEFLSKHLKKKRPTHSRVPFYRQVLRIPRCQTWFYVFVLARWNRRRRYLEQEKSREPCWLPWVPEWEQNEASAKFRPVCMCVSVFIVCVRVHVYCVCVYVCFMYCVIEKLWKQNKKKENSNYLKHCIWPKRWTTGRLPNQYLLIDIFDIYITLNIISRKIQISKNLMYVTKIDLTNNWKYILETLFGDQRVIN